MRAIIGAKLLLSNAAQPREKPFEIYDSRLPGFTLRVQPSGVRSYYARFGRNRRIALGKAGALLLLESNDPYLISGRTGKRMLAKPSRGPGNLCQGVTAPFEPKPRRVQPKARTNVQSRVLPPVAQPMC